MSGLYVHIPFCRSKCGYCDFYSVATHKDSDFAADFINSVVKEIEQKAYLFSNQIVETIYFGGGTPSILPLHHLESIYRAIDSNYHLADKVECTLEMNPEHATDDYFAHLKQVGFVNRLSTGFQAMTDEGLKYLGRR
ncbi:MAG: radical SAM protein, partial [Bacteroidales bacterium]|nr:radical SAM protein [Bacteroidales bacterium]